MDSSEACKLVCVLLFMFLSSGLTVRPVTNPGKGKSVKKRTSAILDPASQAIQEVFLIPVEERTVEQWLTMPREVLQLSAQNSHLIITGSNEELANRLYTHYHPQNTTNTEDLNSTTVIFDTQSTTIAPSGQISENVAPQSLLNDPSLVSVPINTGQLGFDGATTTSVGNGSSSSSNKKRKLPLVDGEEDGGDGIHITDLFMNNPSFLNFFSRTIRDAVNNNLQQQHQPTVTVRGASPPCLDNVDRTNGTENVHDVIGLTHSSLQNSTNMADRATLPPI